MVTNLSLTKKQEEMLYLLRLDGLKREIELHEATEAYEKAKEIEKAVNQYVIDNNSYTVGIENDPEYGEPITLERDSFMIDSTIFESDYLPKVKAAYMSLYNIDNPLNFVYSYPMHERKMKAEKAYHMIAVDFLKISGRPEAAQLEKAVKGYLSPKIKEQLIAILKL
jgi:hypothetical protein